MKKRICLALIRLPYNALSSSILVATYLFFTYGYKLLFKSETLASVAGSHWLDPGSNHWINASTAKIVRSILANNELPIWTKATGIGAPLLSDPNNSLLSPFSFISYAFPETLGWDVVTLLRFFMLIIFVHLLLKQLGVNAWLSIFLAILFGHSGHIFYFGNLCHINTIVFAPLFLLGTLHTLNGESKKGLLLVATSFPLMIFGCGLLDIVLVGVYVTFVVLAFLWFRIIFRDRTHDVYRLSRLLIYTGLGIAIGSIYLIPYLELRTIAVPPYPNRSTPIFNDVWFFLGMFVNKIAVTPQDSSHYYMNYRQYIHILCLPGFLISFFCFFNRNNGNRYFLVGSMLFFLFYLLKLYGFPPIQFINDVMVLKDIRFEKYQAMFNLSFYVLSGAGYTYLLQNPNKAIFVSACTIIILVALLPFLYSNHYDLGITTLTLKYLMISLSVLALYCWWYFASEKYLSLPVLGMALAFLVAGQLWIDMKHKFGNRIELFPVTSEISHLKQIVQDTRVFPMSGPAPREWSAHAINDIRNISVSFTERYYSFFKNHVEHRDCWHLLILCSRRPEDVNLNLVSYIGAGFFTVEKAQINKLAQNQYQLFDVVHETNESAIFQLHDATPLLYVTDEVITAIPADIIKLILETNRNRPYVAHLEEELQLPNNEEPLQSNIEEVEWNNTSINAQINTNKESLLVVKSQFFPGWRAYINEEETKIFRANYLFQGIRLPSGEHQIKFVYAPLSHIAGFLITLSGLIIVIGLYFRIKRQERRNETIVGV